MISCSAIPPQHFFVLLFLTKQLAIFDLAHLDIAPDHVDVMLDHTDSITLVNKRKKHYTDNKEFAGREAKGGRRYRETDYNNLQYLVKRSEYLNSLGCYLFDYEMTTNILLSSLKFRYRELL